MLFHPTLDQTPRLRLARHGQGVCRCLCIRGHQALSHAEWLAILLDRETALRADKRLERAAAPRPAQEQATPEDIDYRAPRGLDRALFQRLLSCAWIDDHELAL